MIDLVYQAWLHLQGSWRKHVDVQGFRLERMQCARSPRLRVRQRGGHGDTSIAIFHLSRTKSIRTFPRRNYSTVWILWSSHFAARHFNRDLIGIHGGIAAS